MTAAATKAQTKESPYSLTRGLLPGLSRDTLSKTIAMRWPTTGSAMKRMMWSPHLRCSSSLEFAQLVAGPYCKVSSLAILANNK